MSEYIEVVHYEEIIRDPLKYFRCVWMKPWFQDLPDAAKSHYLMLCDLALRTGNEIPADMKWIRQNTSAKSKINLTILMKAELVRGEEVGPAEAAGVDYSGDFEEFWTIFPRRRGTNPKKPAARSYARARRDGVSHDTIMKGVRSFKKETEDLEPQFICMAVTWLNQARWEGDTARKELPPGIQEAVEFKKLEASNFLKKGNFAEARSIYSQIERMIADA